MAPEPKGIIGDNYFIKAEKYLSGMVKPKNMKFFTRPSKALAFCIAKCLVSLKNVTASPERCALYINGGPANAQLNLFTDWACENSDPANTNVTDMFTSLMASEVIKLLPNIIMSNISINLPIKGENTLVSGTVSDSVWALKAACRCLESNKADMAVVGSASFPFEYFNLNAFKRFFNDDFFEFPFCEAASCVILTTPEFINKHADLKTGIIGSIIDIQQFEGLINIGHEQTESLDKTLFLPGRCGNFLCAAEPLGLLALLEKLNCSADFKYQGISISKDYFKSTSKIKLLCAKSSLKHLS
jgi:hypothetical protein